MDIEEVLKKHRDDLVQKYKHQQQDHIDVEQIVRFARDGYDLGIPGDEQEYNSIIEHLTHCNACKEEVKAIREMVKQEDELFAPDPVPASPAAVQKNWESFNAQLAGKKKREKAKDVALGFLEKLYPHLLEKFRTAWDSVKELPAGADLALFQEQSPVFTLSDPQLKKEQILLYQVAFAAMATFDQSPETAKIEELNGIFTQFARANKLPKKLQSQFAEFLASLEE